MRRVVAVSSRIVLALLLGLVGFELGLRAIAFVAQRGVLERADDTGGDRLVCIGDSNVFGMFEREEDNYPSRLEQLMRGGAALPVVNRGIPGFSTRHAVRSVQDALERGAPRGILLTAGVNNFWSWQGDGDDDSRPWYEDLRVTRLVRLLIAAAGDGASDGDPDEVWRPEFIGARETNLADDEIRASILTDIAEIAEIARNARVPLAIVGYGAWERVYALAGQCLREAAAQEDLPFIDPSDDVRALCARIGQDAVLHPDLHPRAVGYEVIARRTHDALIELGWIEGDPVGDALAGLEHALGSEPRLHLTGRPDGPPGSPDELSVVIENGVPNAEFRLLLWGLRAPGATGAPDAERSFHELYADDPLFHMSVQHPLMSGRFDSDGAGRVSLAQLMDPTQPLPDLTGMELRACFVVRRNGEVGYLSPRVGLTVPN